MVSLQSNRAATKTAVCSRDLDSSMTGLARLSFGGLWMALGLWSRESVECFKWDLMGHLSGCTGNSSTETCGLWGSRSRGFRENISNWSMDHPCEVWAKNMAAFCLSPKDLPEAKLKSVWTKVTGRGDLRTA